MKAATGVTALLLFVPLLLCWRFNVSYGGFWFLRAGVFLAAFLVLLWRLCLHIDRSWVREAVAVAVSALLALFMTGRLVSFYFQGKSFNEEFFFHFSVETARFALGAFPGLIVLAVAYMALVAAASYLSIYRAPGMPLGNRTLLVPPALLLVLAFDPDIARLAVTSMRDANTSGDIQISTIDWDKYGLNREALYRNSEEIIPGKNVVMIYLEGLEHMYTDQAVFPGLTPFLSSLSDSALHFEHIYQSPGATFTVAGILSSQCGTPLLFPNGPGGNDILKNGFLQKGYCLGDILHDAGYRQVFMGGASTRFAGKGVFLSAHGYDEVLGKEELLPLMADKNYLNNWGLYDDTLLALAEDKFDELAANTSRPFNFTVLTVDTHPPDGTVSASCEPYEAIDNNILDAVHCTDQLVAKFVDHLKQSPAWPNTVVLIMSDHLHMRNSGMEYYPEDYDRRLLVDILNAGIARKVQERGVHMDIAPTLLDLMGVNNPQGFLVGVDMLAPDRAERWVNPDDRQRESIIRYLNTNLLSNIEVGLCEANPLYSFSDNTLRVAGREVDLSMRGQSLPLSVLGPTHALVTLVSREGRVGLTFPVPLSELAYVLFQFREYNFLILAPSETANRLGASDGDFSGLGLVFGNLQDSFTTLQSGIALQEDFNIQSDCGNLLDLSRELTDGVSNDALGRICENRVPDGNVWDPEAGTIELESVSYRGGRLKAHLKRVGQGRYSVTGIEDLPPERPPGSCDAYYDDREILIPGIHTPDGPVSLTMDKILGVQLTFEPGDVTPLPAAGN